MEARAFSGSCEDGLHRDQDFLGNFLVDNSGNVDVVVVQQHGERGTNDSLTVLHFQLAFENAFLLYAVDQEFAFGAYCIRTILLKINLFDDFSLENGFGVFIGFQIIFLEMLPLQDTIEALKGFQFHNPGEGLVSRVQGSTQFTALRLDYFQGGIRFEMDQPSLKNENLYFCIK